MEARQEPPERSIEASLKATYRALLARGLLAGEAANLTAFLHGLPSADFQWTLPEIEAIVRRRLAHAADVRAETAASRTARLAPRGRVRGSTGTGRMGSPNRVTHPPR